MTAPKWTPGPWEAHPRQRTVEGIPVRSGILNDDRIVATAHGRRLAQAEANARLIAAAPELAEMCMLGFVLLGNVQKRHALSGELEKAMVLSQAREKMLGAMRKAGLEG